ncbi:MAG: hypothetical protein JWO99_594 [Candidatus Saccharibacteria bacterium]|nr:hypothetical protein [Candidatus Saccharibacteria bacterium]
MAYIPPNTNGSATSANSAPVVIASDQVAIQTSGSTTALSTAAWTSATTVNTALTIATTGYSTMTMTMSNTSTMTAGVLTFEASPDAGTTWFAIALGRVDSYTTETTYTLSAVANRAWSTSVDGFNAFRVRLSTVITGTGTATIKMAAVSTAIEPIVTVGQATAASLQTTAILATGANLVGKVNITTQTTGGATGFTLISAATTNATFVKASAGVLYMLTATNNSATVAFLKMYNKASAPTVGTDTPVMTFMIPPNGGVMVPIPPTGITFSTGIAYALTGLATLADTTAVSLAQIQLNGAYA